MNLKQKVIARFLLLVMNVSAMYVIIEFPQHPLGDLPLLILNKISVILTFPVFLYELGMLLNNERRDEHGKKEDLPKL